MYSPWTIQTGAIKEGISEEEMFWLTSVIRRRWSYTLRRRNIKMNAPEIRRFRVVGAERTHLYL